MWCVYMTPAICDNVEPQHLRLTEACQTERQIPHGLPGMEESKRAKVLKQSGAVVARGKGSRTRATTISKVLWTQGCPCSLMWPTLGWLKVDCPHRYLVR